MNMLSNKRQVAGNESINFQAETINVNGITYLEARQVALDVFHADFISLSQQAARLAEERVTYLVEQYLQKLMRRNRESLRFMEDPCMQYDLFVARSQCTRTGERFLADILIDTLVEKAQVHENSLLKIVLSESILTISKLTEQQLNGEFGVTGSFPLLVVMTERL